MEDKKIYRIMEMRYGETICRYGVNIATGEPMEFSTFRFYGNGHIPDIGEYVIYVSNKNGPGTYRDVYKTIDPPFSEEDAPDYVKIDWSEPEPWRPHNPIEAIQWLWLNEREPHEVNKYILLLCALFGGAIGLHYLYGRHYLRASVLILLTLMGAWVTAAWIGFWTAVAFYIWLPTEVDGKTEV